MTIFLYGQDTYRSRQKLNEIIENYKKVRKSGLNLRFFDGKELDFEDFRDEALSSPMFAEKKLIILRDIFSSQGFKEKFLKDYKKFVNSRDIILFHEEGEVLESDRLLKLLKKSGDSQEFRPLEGASLKNWIKKEIEKYGTKANPETISRLTEFVGNDTWRLSNEIQKLVSYRASRQRGEGGKECEAFFDHKNGKDIQARDVELLVRPEIDNNIFKTIDAIALKNKKKALELLHKHLEKGDSPLYLLSMINFQFRNLLMIKELIEKNQPYYSILKKTQLKSFVVGKSYQQAQRFGLPELKKIYRKIFQADLDIKTGKIEAETALDLLIAEI